MNMGHRGDRALRKCGWVNEAALAGFAKKSLPTLKEHKKLAEKLPGQ